MTKSQIKHQGTLLTLVSVILFACSAGKDSLPPAPASVNAVKEAVKGKKYMASNAGFHPISNDKQVEWLQPKKDNKTEKDVAEETKSLHLEFVDDTTIIVSIKGKTYKGKYRLDDEKGDDENAGIKLRTTYADESFSFGGNEPMEVTYTYVVEGINSKSLLLLTPRSLNNKKIVVLLDSF